MVTPQLRRLILAENPWLQGEDLLAWIRHFLPASYIPRRQRLVADHRVVLVVGPRQAGKSTLIWKTLEEAAEPVLYVNCEEPSMREWLSSPAEFLADVREHAGAARALFFEEVQRLPEAGLFSRDWSTGGPVCGSSPPAAPRSTSKRRPANRSPAARSAICFCRCRWRRQARPSRAVLWHRRRGCRGWWSG